MRDDNSELEEESQSYFTSLSYFLVLLESCKPLSIRGNVFVEIKTYSFAFGPSIVVYSSKSIFYTSIHLRVLLEKKSGECNSCSTIFGLAVSGGRE